MKKLIKSFLNTKTNRGFHFYVDKESNKFFVQNKEKIELDFELEEIKHLYLFLQREFIDKIEQNK